MVSIQFSTVIFGKLEKSHEICVVQMFSILCKKLASFRFQLDHSYLKTLGLQVFGCPSGM